MRTDLWDDPRVCRLCDLLGTTEATVIGGLYRFWAIADGHSVDGVLVGITARSLDAKTGLPGFAAALQAVDWLHLAEQSVAVPRFDAHNGESAKRRCRNATNQQRSRAEKVLSPPAGDRSMTRLDETRKDKNTGPTPEREESFGQACAASIGLVPTGSARLGPVSGDWQKWDSLRELHRAIVVPSAPPIAFSGKVTTALMCSSLQVVAAWLKWQAGQPRPLLPATEASLAMVWAVIKAKRVAKVSNVAAAVITLVSGRTKNSQGERVDRSSEWQEAERLVAWSIAQVSEFLRPTKPALVPADSPSASRAASAPGRVVSAELLALEAEFGAAIDAAPIDELIELLSEPTRTFFRSRPDRTAKMVRPKLLRALAAQQLGKDSA